MLEGNVSRVAAPPKKPVPPKNPASPPVLVPTTVWRATPELIIAIDERFGEPVDCYVNGSQVWLREDGPNDVMLEWRLHPVPRYARPNGTTTYDVFSTAAMAFAQGAPPPAPLSSLWDGLECFAAYDDEIEPAVLARAATEALGLAPDAVGLVDHQAIATRWETSQRATSIVDEMGNLLRIGG